MKPLIVFNWKMNPGTEAEATELFARVVQAARGAKNISVVVAPPFPFISPIEKRWGIREAEARKESVVHLAAQDTFWEGKGAFTGEVSPVMETGLGVTYVILGHSERRRVLGETDEMVNRKLSAALEFGLHPILCIGEESRDGDGVPESVGNQLKGAIRDIPPLMLETSLSVAYEPVWAISGGASAGTSDTPADTHKAAIYIRKILSEMYGEGLASRVSVLYGGSVTSQNAPSFITETEGTVNGVLVGRASLDAEEATALITAVDNANV